MGFCKFKNVVYRIDIRIVPFHSLPFSLLYFTGPYNLNTSMRSLSKKLGYTLNEYGLYKNKKSIPAKTEEDIFNLLYLSYLPPKDRK
jgi:DNA polymerase beta